LWADVQRFCTKNQTCMINSDRRAAASNTALQHGFAHGFPYGVSYGVSYGISYGVSYGAPQVPSN